MAETADKQFLKSKIRLLKILSKEAQRGAPFKIANILSVIKIGAKSFSFEALVVEHCVEENLVSKVGDRLFLTGAGRAHLLRALHPENEFTSQHAQLSEKTIRMNGEQQLVIVNESESPLARLYLRKAQNGKSWLNDHEFQAGERLRADFEKSQLQPRISANWVASVASSGRSGNASAEISDFALDARKRVETAISALGSDLANVALDICCFLKGLEAVERERNWPPRSAKLMLRTALRALVHHYGLGAKRSKTSMSPNLGHWGAEDFRPSI